MNPRALRRVARVVHLVAATALALHVYSPLGQSDAYLTAIRFGTFPVLTATGLAIWLAPRMWSRQRRRRVAVERG